MSEQLSITPDPVTVQQIKEMGLAGWARERSQLVARDTAGVWVSIAEAAEAVERRAKLAERAADVLAGKYARDMIDLSDLTVRVGDMEKITAEDAYREARESFSAQKGGGTDE